MTEQLVETVDSVASTGRATTLARLAQAIRDSGGRVIERGLSGLSGLAAAYLSEDLGGAPCYPLTRDS